MSAAIPSFHWPLDAARVPSGGGLARSGPASGPGRWRERWLRGLARAGVLPGERLTVALSGGADSVFLLDLACSTRADHPLVAVHVDHGLRGSESDEDVRHCRELCALWDVPLEVVRIPPSALPNGEVAGLEERCREERYRLLGDAAQRNEHRTIVTAHHADDGLETLLLRWIRGGDARSLPGLERRRKLHAHPGVNIARPLVDWRRAEIVDALEERGIDWREDSSNRDLRFARNRIRHELLPAIERTAGSGAIENLFRFAAAAESSHQIVRQATRHLGWEAPRFARALGPAPDPEENARVSVLARAALLHLSPALRRSALVRLLAEATGRTPGRRLLARVLDDLEHGRRARHTLPGGWDLQLRAAQLLLSAPNPSERNANAAASGEPCAQLELPFPQGEAPGEARPRRLDVPGRVALTDGRWIAALPLRPGLARPIPRSETEVELDLDLLEEAGLADGALAVRPPEPGERFHPLGAPGSRPLRRFLADAGIARAQRARVPLVCAGREIVWVAGVRPAERFRVRSTTRRRLRLSLYDPR